MSKNSGLQPEVIANKCVGGIQSVRMNYYPPCAEADKVVGFSPHSDADLLALVLQVNQVQDLHRRKVPEHRAPGRDQRGERAAVRCSIPCHSPSIHATIGPLTELLTDQEREVAMYKTVDHESFMRLYFSAKLEGKSFLQRMKL
ncbi:hypothetical protein BAE44_0011938 [Dichanthelium oligosanthes]|uniref:Isopenicillin N synthase-like Fe(2+) 2OG dioxygenase domain-containing protein n=1 Tax=Dichanthelium oligosanthes TaxID=888268 RepID=A0A1E5VPN5_9POAL|nr:hypothetical protein BAE44_0011938 [Dichanthelium oligosanthes]